MCSRANSREGPATEIAIDQLLVYNEPLVYKRETKIFPVLRVFKFLLMVSTLFLVLQVCSVPG